MSKVLYSTTATVTGGRDKGHGRTDDGALEVDLRLPAEMGGAGGGTNPEQLFAVGYASCFESALFLVGRRHKVDVTDAVVESAVALSPTGEGGFRLGVTLAVTLPTLDDPQTARKVVEAAHAACPYSNAIRGNVDVGLSVNGAEL